MNPEFDLVPKRNWQCFVIVDTWKFSSNFSLGNSFKPKNHERQNLFKREKLEFNPTDINHLYYPRYKQCCCSI